MPQEVGVALMQRYLGLVLEPLLLVGEPLVDPRLAIDQLQVVVLHFVAALETAILSVLPWSLQKRHECC